MGAILIGSAGTIRMVNYPLNHPATGGRKTGSHWERAAESYLRTQGLKLLQRNFSSRFGEIDLIMRDGQTVVFVEVKYRKSNEHGSGADAVTFHKQERISRTAAWYLVKNPHRAESICRFDVISIDPGENDQGIDWIKNAFYSTFG